MLRLFLTLLATSTALAGCQSVRDVARAPVPNPGPCPNALSLYDAHRLVQINGDDLVFENVGFTAEILNVTSSCRYTDENTDPISNRVQVRMAVGRGPAAVGQSHTYELFVAVTGFNALVIEKQIFPVAVTFEPGEDRVEIVETFDPILLPRAANDTSGANFEILVGFELTEDQLEFNRSGLRFRVNAGQD